VKRHFGRNFHKVKTYTSTSVKILNRRGRTRRLRSKSSNGEDVHADFGLNLHTARTYTSTSVKIRNRRGHTRQLRSKSSHGEDVHVNFGLNLHTARTYTSTSVKIRNRRGRTRQLRSKSSHGEDVHVNFGANKLNETSNKRCLYCVRIAAVFHTPSASPSHHQLVLRYNISCTSAAKSNKQILRAFLNP
jgi:uncharacterized protein YqgV (UPF0045/DUF77 family)